MCYRDRKSMWARSLGEKWWAGERGGHQIEGDCIKEDIEAVVALMEGRSDGGIREGGSDGGIMDGLGRE